MLIVEDQPTLADDIADGLRDQGMAADVAYDGATGLDKASVTAEVLGGTKGPKIVIQKYKNKTGYKKRQGHRQKYTQVKVTAINA